ncbi:hypothetical protein C8035_v011382 [Colletotrichum spinosum]|uniref:Uncharacterized protein n=1 Tax=Colletotrichum spinosum TaxID=1347390 RepID=A0A4R8PUB5_9PEZI|nr:hypothetical protein C8035_v011382 [Colletotrichum spinosum]
MFADFGIACPSGWLSDNEEEEDLSLHQDGTNSIPTRIVFICHSCGDEVTTRTFCPNCGHSVCPQCSKVVLDADDSLEDTEEIAREIVASEGVKKRGSDSAPTSPETRLSSPPEWLSPAESSSTTQRKTVSKQTEDTTQTNIPSIRRKSPHSDSVIEWPKLKKVSRETPATPVRSPLPWMQRPLRRVQKEENIGQQAQGQETASEIEACRAQLRNISAPSEGDESARLSPPKATRLEEVKTTTSRTLHSKSETVTETSRTMEETESISEPKTSEEGSVRYTGKGKETMAQVPDDLEVLSPIPIMTSNHTCSWRERYHDLAAEVRQLKAEISSREASEEPRLADVGVNVDRRDGKHLGIEGLTVILHLKGKDDLVIKADLTQASSSEF